MKPLVKLYFALMLLAVAGFASAQKKSRSPSDFALHDGDRVVFYGDSITAQRLYTVYLQTAVHAHYPEWKIHFYNAGVGGDKVSGGVAGPIDERLRRDVLSRKPTVVTIMLGMNDRGNSISKAAYAAGYEHILQRVHAEAPDALITILGPTPLDDVTRHENKGNEDLIHFVEIDRELAQKYGAVFIDLNAPVIAALNRANAIDHRAAVTAIPDRVHPEGAIHMLMAETILRGWSFPQNAASVEIDAHTGQIRKQSESVVSEVRVTDRRLSWKEADAPDQIPFNANDGNELMYRLLSDRSHLGSRLLQVTGLHAGEYELSIDDKPMSDLFSAEQLSVGVDLAGRDTPMHTAARSIYYACSDSEIDQVVRNRLLGRASEIEPAKLVEPGDSFIEESIGAAEARIASAAVRTTHQYVIALRR